MAGQHAEKKTPRPVSKSRLIELIGQTTLDCCDDDEAKIGFFMRIEEDLEIHLTMTVLGVKVEVISVDLPDDGSVVVGCARGKARQRIPILDLPLTPPPPAGSEWIEAYRLRLKGN